jgi:hypothetical protein
VHCLYVRNEMVIASSVPSITNPLRNSEPSSPLYFLCFAGLTKLYVLPLLAAGGRGSP